MGDVVSLQKFKKDRRKPAVTRSRLADNWLWYLLAALAAVLTGLGRLGLLR